MKINETFPNFSKGNVVSTTIFETAPLAMLQPLELMDDNRFLLIL